MNRWIVVSSGNSPHLYIGKTEFTDSEVVSAIRENQPVKLTDCRLMVHMMGAGAGTDGKPVMHSAVNMIPLPLCANGASILVHPSAYINPEENPGMEKAIEILVEDCTRVELDMRAAEVGISLATGLPSNRRKS